MRERIIGGTLVVTVFLAFTTVSMLLFVAKLYIGILILQSFGIL